MLSRYTTKTPAAYPCRREPATTAGPAAATLSLMGGIPAGSPPPLTARTVRAAVCDGSGGLAPATLPLAGPATGELLLRLRCAGLCGTDLWKLRQGTARPGSVLGHEVVGVVEAIGGPIDGAVEPGDGGDGYGDRRLAPGDRVVVVHHVPCGVCPLCRDDSETMCAAFRDNLLAPGGFSELVVVRAAAARRGAFRLPPHLSDQAAVFLEPAACVLRGMRRAGLLTPEARALAVRRPVIAVLGAGSMGLLHLLVLRALVPAAAPAATPDESPLVVLSDPLAERRALALRLGADAAAAPGDAVRRAVRELSQGRGADLVFDTVGGAAPLAEALQLGRPGSAVVIFAHAAARDEPAGFPLNAFFKAERRLVATYSSAPAEQRAAYLLLAGGRLDPGPLVSHRLPLSRAAEAAGLAASHRALKLLFVPDAPTDRAGARPAAPATPSAAAPAGGPG
jgi:L-iditol 2-dehydrogenase